MKLIEAYRKFRASGDDANRSLRNAKTLIAFQQAESDGLVRMRCEAEQESYLDNYGEPEGYTSIHGRRVSAEQARKELIDILDRLGVWWTCAEWFDGDEWQQADSCGMHTGYKNPLSPFENCYVIDEMQSALDALALHQTELRETELATNWP